MKRLHRKWLIGLVFVCVIAASMWFAAPTFASMTQRTAWPGANAAYTATSTIIITKVDINTNQIVRNPGFKVKISPDPYTLVPGSFLIVIDNYPDPSGNYDLNTNYGEIKLINVIGYNHYTFVEVNPPDGYLLDPNTYPLVVPDGGTGYATSNDQPITVVPASSNTGMWLMVGIFATLISGLILWRSRRAQISHR